MALIEATTKTYDHLLRMPGLTFVMLDVPHVHRPTAGSEYCLTTFRRIGNQHIATAVHVNIRTCQVPPEDHVDFVPTFRLYRDGVRIDQDTRNHGFKRLVKLIESLADRPDPFSSADYRRREDTLSCDLRHGLEFAARNESGRLCIRDVADFLGDAVEHFKHERDDLKTQICADGHFTGAVLRLGKVIGRLQVVCHKPERLPTASWVESVIDAYCRANTVQQIEEQLGEYLAAVEREGSSLKEIVKMVEHGYGLEAFAAMVAAGHRVST